MKQALAISRKELRAYFGSPMALIFLGAFLVVTLFAFFWVETFFARAIADVRPLFRWMPVLTILLVAALTMRQWSEEQRAGTLEVLLTLPVRRTGLVLGKFLAVMALVGLALALTLCLPITVDILGPLDWGPVVGGYLAALLMASAYTAIGLFVSSRTDNQIVALIVTVLLGAAFYILGTNGITGLVGNSLGVVLRAIGTGSRFESIERGVIDLRDLIYYLSLTALFLALNITSLDAKRWSHGTQTAAYRRHVLMTILLITANLIALNTWLFPLGALRADLTADRAYSLSPTTRNLIKGLQEPLLIRGYFSEKTHPLLAPLVPAIQDMLREYELASRGKIQVEIVDPRDNEELEAEANQLYGIQPSPFRISGRYEASVINSYFDLLIRYGDQHVTLGFADLIEVEAGSGGQVDVRLRNLEYDLTRSIKKVVYGFQSIDAAFASIQEPVKLTAYITPQTLPEGLADVPQHVENVGQALQQESGGKFTFEIVDPDAPGSPVTRQTLSSELGLRPIAVSLFSPDSYYLHMVLQIGEEAQLLYPSGDLSEADIRTEIEAALKRAAPGFLKTVGLWLPNLQAMPDAFGQLQQPISSWNSLRQQLSQNYTVRQVDLTSGRVPGDVDVLVVVAPQGMTDQERFAIDQYLMRGGALVVAAGHFMLAPQQLPGGLTLQPIENGLEEMLASYGVKIGESMVLDPRNEPFPVEVTRQVGNTRVLEIQELSYPFFVDVRSESMDRESPIVASLPAITLQWTSPLTITATEGREVQVLLASTRDSWLRSSPNVQPDLDTWPEFGFPVEGEQRSWPLAVSLRGSFESYFKGKPSPFEVTAGSAVTATAEMTSTLGTIEASPGSSRLIVIGSAEFIDDAVLQISSRLSADRYLNNLQFMQNAVDWSVEDEDLLAIRSRGTYTRLLRPLDRKAQTLWEGLNYGVALMALIAVGVVWNVRRRNERPLPLFATDLQNSSEPGTVEEDRKQAMKAEGGRDG